MIGEYVKLENGEQVVRINSVGVGQQILAGDVVFIVTEAGLQNEIIRSVVQVEGKAYLCSVHVGAQKRAITEMRNGNAYGHIDVPAHWA